MSTEYKPFPLSSEHMLDITLRLRQRILEGTTTNQEFCIVELIERKQTFNLTFYWNKTIKDFVLLNIVKHDS